MCLWCVFTDSEFIPAGNQPLTSWGQRACLSCGLPLTWDKSRLARKAGVQWGWREGWRKAPRASPVTAGSQDKIKHHSVKAELPCSVIFSVFSMEICSMCFIFHLCVLYSVSARADVVVLSVNVCQWYAEQWKISLHIECMCVSSVSEAVCSTDWPPREIDSAAGWKELQQPPVRSRHGFVKHPVENPFSALTHCA